jgi:2-phosphosulfolactate phosphatase
LRLHVFFHPAEVQAVEADPHGVYIVIDAIRATTTMTVLLDQGVSRIFASRTVEQAKQCRTYAPQRILCGERQGKALPGFDYGNSPAEFSQLDLQSKEVVLTTSNGTKAFFTCPPESLRLAGCFYNAQAVTAYALQYAQEHNCDLGIVCSAEYGYFSLEDATTAGYLAHLLAQADASLALDDSVHAARTLYETYAPPRLADYSSAVAEIHENGMSQDLPYCFQIDGSSSVAKVTGVEHETGLIILEKVRQPALALP